MTIGAFVGALLACELPPAELAAQIKAELPAADATKLEKLIAIAPPERLEAVVTAYVKGLVKAEKADAKRKRDRENIAAKRDGGSRDIRDSRDIGDSATRATSATPLSLKKEKEDLSLSAKTRFPKDWKPSDETRLLAINKFGEQAGLNVIAKFRLHRLSRDGPGVVSADWQAECCKWILNERPPRQVQMHLVGGKVTNDDTDKIRTNSTSRRDGARCDPTVAGVGNYAAKKGLL
jgi:hypothetical protein